MYIILFWLTLYIRIHTCQICILPPGGSLWYCNSGFLSGTGCGTWATILQWYQFTTNSCRFHRSRGKGWGRICTALIVRVREDTSQWNLLDAPAAVLSALGEKITLGTHSLLTESWSESCQNTHHAVTKVHARRENYTAAITERSCTFIDTNSPKVGYLLGLNM